MLMMLMMLCLFLLRYIKPWIMSLHWARVLRFRRCSVNETATEPIRTPSEMNEWEYCQPQDEIFNHWNLDHKCDWTKTNMGDCCFQCWNPEVVEVMDTSTDPKLQEAQAKSQSHPHQDQMVSNRPNVNKTLVWRSIPCAEDYLGDSIRRVHGFLPSSGRQWVCIFVWRSFHGTLDCVTHNSLYAVTWHPVIPWLLCGSRGHI